MNAIIFNCYVVKKEPMKNYHGWVFDVGLPRKQGFIKVKWFIGENNFVYENKIVEKRYINIYGDIVNNYYIDKNGVKVKNIEINAQFIELLPDWKKKKDDNDEEIDEELKERQAKELLEMAAENGVDFSELERELNKQKEAAEEGGEKENNTENIENDEEFNWDE